VVWGNFAGDGLLQTGFNSYGSYGLIYDSPPDVGNKAGQAQNAKNRLYSNLQRLIVPTDKYPYSIDYSRGLVFFSTPIFAYNTTEDRSLRFPELFLRTSSVIRDEKTNVPIRSKNSARVEYDDDEVENTIDMANSYQMLIEKPELIQTLVSHAGTDTLEVDLQTEQFEFYLQQAQLSLQPVVPVTVRIASGNILPNKDYAETSGIVRSITVSASTRGVETIVSMNDDQGSYVSLPYKEDLRKHVDKYQKQRAKNIYKDSGGVRPWWDRKNGTEI